MKRTVRRHPADIPAVDRPPVDPTDDDLASIEDEWTQIEADLAALDAEIAALLGEPTPPVDELARRRERRRTRRTLGTIRTALPAVA